jgi:hypothetical protein
LPVRGLEARGSGDFQARLKNLQKAGLGTKQSDGLEPVVIYADEHGWGALPRRPGFSFPRPYGTSFEEESAWQPLQ